MKGFIKLALVFTSLYAYNATTDIEAGNKYLKENNINLAIAAFERVLMYEPNNEKANFALFKIYAKLKNIDLAKKYIKKIKNPTPDMKKEIDAFLKKYDRRVKFDITLLVGMNLDSNLNNDTDANSWNIYQNNTSKTIHNYSDKEYGFSVYELVSIDPVYTKEFQIHNNLTVFNKNIISHSENDIQVISYTPSLNHTYKNLNLKHYLNYTYTRYGGEDYTHKFGIGEEVNFGFLDSYTNTTNLSFNYIHYLTSNINNDNYYLLNLSSKLNKNIKTLNLFTNLSLEGTKKTKSSQNATQYKLATLGIGLNWQISKYIINLNTNYTLKKYLDENLLFQKYEFDKKIDSEISFIKKGKYLDYQTKLEVINNISNIEPYSYNKWILSVNIIKQFKGL